MGSVVSGADRRAGQFWRGLLVGAGPVVAALAMGLGYLTHAGITVAVAAEPLAGRVAAEVEAAVRRELPAALLEARAEWPQRAQEAARGQLADLRLEVAGLTVNCPSRSGNRWKRRSREAVQAALEAAGNGAPFEGLTDRIGRRAGELARERLPSALAGQRFNVQVAPGVAVPVERLGSGEPPARACVCRVETVCGSGWRVAVVDGAASSWSRRA